MTRVLLTSSYHLTRAAASSAGLAVSPGHPEAVRLKGGVDFGPLGSFGPRGSRRSVVGEPC